MPVSKRRKPKQHLRPHAMPPYQAKAHFKQLAQMDGQLFPIQTRTVAASPGPESTSFTNAWTLAHTNGQQAVPDGRLDYAEGVAWRDDTGWVAHAWCVTTDGDIVETTHGFEAATTYKGWILDRAEAATITHGDTPTRPVLETGLIRGGGKWTDLIAQIAKN